MYRSMVGTITPLDQRQYASKVKRLKMGTQVRGWITNTFVITRSDCGSGTYSSVSQRKNQRCEGVGSGRRNLLCKGHSSELCRDTADGPSILSLGPGMGFGNLKAHPQSHTYSNQATPLNTSK